MYIEITKENKHGLPVGWIGSVSNHEGKSLVAEGVGVLSTAGAASKKSQQIEPVESEQIVSVENIETKEEKAPEQAETKQKPKKKK